MAGTIIVDRIESDASYASSINVAAQVTFSNTVNFGVSSVAPVAGVYSPTTNNLAFTTASTERMRIDSAGNVGIGTASPGANLEVKGSSGQNIYVSYTAGSQLRLKSDSGNSGVGTTGSTPLLFLMNNGEVGQFDTSSNFKFNSGYGSVATAYGCRAWVNFNGTGTVAIRGSGNVTSITDGGVGVYTVNFTNAMPDASYSICGTVGRGTGFTSPRIIGVGNTNPTAGAAQVSVISDDGVFNDCEYTMVAIIR
jgi:hypothetical protein